MDVRTVISEKYLVEKEIKRGGFGVIYRGLDQNFGKPVAIKAIEPSLLEEARYIDMFQQEAVNIARLNHQNIVQVYDVKRESNGQIFIIMEFIDGFDLMTLLKACRHADKPLSSTLTAYIIAEVCNGLDYAHNRKNPDATQPMGLVHKDISPVNIMISRSGEVKLIDFGMANFRRQQPQMDGGIQIQGNLRYLAPEQIKKSGTIDRRTDIFAAGVILFEMLTGERLVPAASMQQVVEDVLMGDYDLTRLNRDDIPVRLQQVAHKALQHNPAQRYPSANHMYRELMHFLILTAPAADFMSEMAGFLREVQPERFQNGQNGEDSTMRMEPNQKNPADAPTGHSSSVEAAEEVPREEADDVSNQTSPDSDNGNNSETESTNSSDDDDFKGFATHESDSSSRYYSFVDDGDDDGQKTIIDVVRLSARTHRKAIIATLTSLVLGFVTFSVVDTFAQITPMGSSIYDFLFPPAIKIVSIPTGAKIYIDDQPLEKPTPVALEEISPGVHKLMLTLPQYEPIVKSINVPRQGDLRLSGEARRHASQPYTLRFRNQFEITSEPGGAGILIDGVQLNQKTPATVFWDVGEEPTNIELELSGLPKLTGLSINSIIGEEYIADKRIWKLDKPVEGRAHYLIEGIFHKNVTINSKPKLADIYYNDGDTPVGVTGVNGSLMLKMGQHSFRLKREGYFANSFQLDVNTETPAVITKELYRNVRIFAKDASSEDDKDLGATLVDVSLNSYRVTYNKRTPVIVKLLPYTYTATLTRKGYHDLQIKVAPDDKSVIAKMTPLFCDVTIEAIDAITSVPISSAKINYQLENSTEPERTIGITDENGSIIGQLLPGAYEITISKSGYREQRKAIKLRTDAENKLTFRLTGLR